MVVLGGSAPSLGSLFVDEVRRVLAAHVVPPILERMRIGIGVVGAPAATLGAAWGALDLLVDSGALVRPEAPRRRLRKAALRSPSGSAKRARGRGEGDPVL
jgi:hypothetical protein